MRRGGSWKRRERGGRREGGGREGGEERRERGGREGGREGGRVGRGGRKREKIGKVTESHYRKMTMNKDTWFCPML